MTANGRRIAIWTVLAVLFAGALAYAFRPLPVAVDPVSVTRAPMLETVSAEGKTRIRDVFVLSAPVAGRVLRIEADAGDPVTGGTTALARIEPSDPAFLDERTAAEARADLQAAEAALALARAELDQSRADRDFARTEFARARALIKTETIPRRAYDEADRTLRMREAGVATAEAAVRMRASEVARANARLLVPSDRSASGKDCACVVVRAPVDGRILRVLQESEAVVAAGTPLVEIGDPSKIEVVADFLSSDAVRIESGQRALLEDWGGIALNGRVRLVEPYGFTKVSALGIEEQRVNVIIDLTDPPDARARLGHGFRVEARIVLWENEAALQLPLTALFRDGGKWAVFAMEDGRARLRHISVGRRNHLAAEIEGGLKEGEQVVGHPGDRISDGARVEARPR